MIDIRELRINSHVLFNGERVRVVGTYNDSIVVIDTDKEDEPITEECVFISNLDPIPINPEIVEEIGFEKGDESKESKIFYQDPICKKLIQKCQKNPELAKEFAEQTFCSLFHYENEEKKEVWLLICEKGQVYVSYLHELENMYHYLTGREL